MITPHPFHECAFVYAALSIACDLAVNFEVYTLTNSDNVCDECCVLTCTSDTHLRRRIVVISVMNSQWVSFRIPPKFIVDLPQSVFECAFNAQRRLRKLTIVCASVACAMACGRTSNHYFPLVY
jgi:hypothetical protein